MSALPTATEIIEDEIVNLMRTEGLEDTPAIRRDLLFGIRDAWLEDQSKSIDKSIFMIAINVMISCETVKASLAR